jgi:hypothetical protein
VPVSLSLYNGTNLIMKGCSMKMRNADPADIKSTLNERLNEATRYIGELNVQMKEMRTVFSISRKYPKNRRDFSKTLRFLSKKALGIINVDWVLFRIIGSSGLRTLAENFEVRGGKSHSRCSVSNASLWQGLAIGGSSVIRSEPQNLPIKTFCILPTTELNGNQRILIESLVGLLEMYFIIYRPEYLADHGIDNNAAAISEFRQIDIDTPQITSYNHLTGSHPG